MLHTFSGVIQSLSRFGVNSLKVQLYFSIILCVSFSFLYKQHEMNMDNSCLKDS